MARQGNVHGVWLRSLKINKSFYSFQPISYNHKYLFVFCRLGDWGSDETKKYPSHVRALFQIITSRSLRYGLSTEHKAIYNRKVATVQLWTTESNSRFKISVLYYLQGKHLTFQTKKKCFHKVSIFAMLCGLKINTDKLQHVQNYAARILIDK